jgi:polyhydroxyalkanoate synthesis regulator phasin
MKVSKSALLAAGVTTVVGLSSLGVAGLASAATDTGSSTLVDKIAQKFNLNKDEVQKVFDEQHEVRRAEMRQKRTDTIARAVKDGKISQEKADQLTAKLKELESFMDGLKDKTHQERHEAMKTKMDELRNWADENGIPDSLLRGPRGGHGHGHRMHGPES